MTNVQINMTTEVKRGRGRPKMIREVSLGAMKANQDWQSIFANVLSVDIHEVDKVSAVVEPTDDHGFLSLGKLKDGRWFALRDPEGGIFESRKEAHDTIFGVDHKNLLIES